MPDPAIFRSEAILHYATRQQDGVPVQLRIAPAWTWWVFWALFASALVAVLLSLMIKIEVQNVGLGRFHSVSIPIESQVSGRVCQIAASKGQQVVTGTLLLEVEPTDIQALTTGMGRKPGSYRIIALGGGTVEGLHVRVGDVVNAGQVLGRILPSSIEPAAYALLAEKDRAQVGLGDTVRLEVDQYPKADWGTLNATIHRVPDSPATPSELREIFGEGAKPGAPSYIVELRLLPVQGAKVGGQTMQSGMGFQANFALKPQRPIVFVLEPLRRWLE